MSDSSQFDAPALSLLPSIHSTVATMAPVAPPAPDAAPAADAPNQINHVDATVGQPIVERVTARRLELEALLARLPADEARARGDIERALDTIASLLTGDLAQVPRMVSMEMSRWLEQNKHLAESASPDAPVATEAETVGTGE